MSLLGIGLYYFIYFKAQTVISDLVANAVVYGVKIKGAAYPLYLFGRMAEGDWTAMALVSAVVALLTALTWLLLSRSFLRLATSGGSTGKARYREKKARVCSLQIVQQQFRVDDNPILRGGGRRKQTAEGVASGI